MNKLLCLVFFGLSFSVIHAQDVLNFGNNSFPPFVYEGTVDGKTVAMGIKVDILQAILKQAGLKPATIQFFPWARCQELVKLGQLDGLLPTFKTPERETYATFSLPVMKQRAAFIYSKAKYPNGFPAWKNYDTLKTLRLGMLFGGVIDKDMEAAFSSVKPIERATEQVSLIRMIPADRFDIVAMDRSLAAYLIAQEKLEDKLGISTQNINELDAYIALSNASGASKHISAINAAILELQKTKVLEQLAK